MMGRHGGWGRDPSTGDLILGDVTDPAYSDQLYFYGSALDSSWKVHKYYFVSPHASSSIASDADMLPDVDFRVAGFYGLGRSDQYPDTVLLDGDVGYDTRW